MGSIKHIYEAGIDNMVVLISTSLDGKNYVMTSGTVAEVSHTPPLLLVSICPQRYTHDIIRKSRVFAVNVLSKKQKMLAVNCGSRSGRDIDKFKEFNLKYSLGECKVPLINGCLANIECRVVAEYPHGDHTIFVGEMVDAAVVGNRKYLPLLISDVNTVGPRFLWKVVRKIPGIFILKNVFITQKK